MADSYESFARVYDELMDNVPYDEWTSFLMDVLQKSDIRDGLVCELGCGTGNVTQRLANAGYDMIGIDNSYDMLTIAREKQYDTDEPVSTILYLQQDMREFELYGTVRAIVSICDSVNYMQKPEDLVTVFKLVNNYLDPKGLFLFDFNTEYKYREVIGDCTIAENREDCSFIWENHYDLESKINEYDLTIFVKETFEEEEFEIEEMSGDEGDAETDEMGGKAEDDISYFARFRETHYQRGYTLEEMKWLVEKAGLVFVSAIDMDTKDEPTKKSERIFVIAREQGK